LIEEEINVGAEQLAADDLGVMPEVERKVYEQDVEQPQQTSAAPPGELSGEKTASVRERILPRPADAETRARSQGIIGPRQHPSRHLVKRSSVGKWGNLKPDVDQLDDRVIQHDRSQQVANSVMENPIDES
jgi:hypothetical protein